MKNWKSTGLCIAAAAAVMLLAAGCGTLGRSRVHRSNNLFKFLYGSNPGRVDEPTIPVLSLPLKVAVAFVPVDQDKDARNYSYSRDDAFTEAHKLALLQKISAEFKSYPFVKSIEVIPAPYLTPRGGFENLEQLQKLYGVDVVALVSYDQAQFTDEGALSLAYWTVVGAYLIKAEKNETRTMLDAAVYDIASHKMLFRAPGLSSVKGRATMVNLSEELRRDSERGFQEAATNLVSNLQAELKSFQERVKNAPTEYKVVHKAGYKGSGSFGALDAGLAVLVVAGGWLMRPRVSK